MKLKYTIDIDMNEDDAEMQKVLADDLKEFVKDHEYSCIANNITVRLQDEYSTKQDRGIREDIIRELDSADVFLRNRSSAPHSLINMYDVETMLQIASTCDKAAELLSGCEQLPCKIGDIVWAIKRYKGHKHVEEGRVNDMAYDNNMRLVIRVKHITRGEWGTSIFPSKEAAEHYLIQEESEE